MHTLIFNNWENDYIQCQSFFVILLKKTNKFGYKQYMLFVSVSPGFIPIKPVFGREPMHVKVINSKKHKRHSSVVSQPLLSCTKWCIKNADTANFFDIFRRFVLTVGNLYFQILMWIYCFRMQVLLFQIYLWHCRTTLLFFIKFTQ